MRRCLHAAVTVAELIRTKQLSPVEYLQALLEQIQRLNPG